MKTDKAHEAKSKESERYTFSEGDLIIAGSEQALLSFLENIRNLESGEAGECSNKLSDILYQIERQFGIVNSGE
jgi:hypothetical protein